MAFKNVVTIFTLLIFISFSSGCTSASHTKDVSPIEGKFVFDALRSLEEPWGIFTWEEGKIKKFNRAISPIWSKDGENIACVKDSTISIFDTKGNLLQSFPETKGAVKIAWSPDNTQFAYTAEGPSSRKRDCIFLYNSRTGEKEKLVDYNNEYTITEVSYSPKGDKILFWRSDINDIKNCGVFIYDLETSSIVFIYPQGDNPAWFPDGKHILVLTNRNEDWSMINNKLGVFMKINIETGEKTVLRDSISFVKDIKVSKDGKCFYYSKPVSKGGYIIVVSPIDRPDIEISLTKPVLLSKSQGYSQDFDADWYQGD